jgi:pimeloyl-ACP methyl ester carboxylesterase
MRSIGTFLCTVILIVPTVPLSADPLEPGFDVSEYQELLKVFGSYMGGREIPASERFTLVHRTPSVGLDNLLELYVDADGVAAISIRGSTRNAASWMENAYAAMTPASGVLQLEKELEFQYRLAEDPKAAVHIGWLIGMAYLQRELMPLLDPLIAAGGRDLLVFGHSQGGGIAYLLTAHLLHLRETGIFPSDMRVKTYCSAGPKPGNLFFAYDYEHRTRGGWAFNVVNASDWVPEVPVTIQTTDDLNTVNPFSDSRALIGKQPLVKRIVLRKIYNRLDKPARRAQRNYEKYLGRAVGRQVTRHLPEYRAGEYASTTNYVRTGTTIVLMPDEEYHRLYPDDQARIFIHHMLEPYLYLARKYERERIDEERSVR